jgi:hypothetical protein
MVILGMASTQPTIHLMTNKATQQQLSEMAAYYNGHIKVAVDIERGILAGGGKWHADCEKVLIEQGSQQENIWGGGYHVSSKKVDYYALINIRPKQDNPDQDILSQEIRAKVESIVRDHLE